jgi:isopenicillin-N epimerase
MRELFLLDPGIVFLNHGSFGACPAEVLAAQQAWQREMERNPVEFLARRSAALLAESRARLAEYLGAHPENLVYLANATTAVNTVAHSLDLRPGDEVLTTDHEYGACEATWEHACRRADARLVRAVIPLPFRAGELVDRLLARTTERTRLVFLSHVTSTTALIFPVAEACRAARERGILTFVDGAHAPGQLSLSLETIGADFYAGNCHKWLCAPKGCGFLHVRPEHHDRLDGLVVSWGTCGDGEEHASYTGSTVLERRHQWQGTRDISAFLAVPAAIDFQRRHDWERVRLEGHALARETRERVVALTGLPAICGDDDFAQMAAIALPPCEPEELRRTLFELFRIEVPVTTHTGRPFLRPAFQAYNSRSDADALLAALEHVLPRTV